MPPVNVIARENSCYASAYIRKSNLIWGEAMAAKKDKSGIEGLRNDIRDLQDSFARFRDAMLTEAALSQAERQTSHAAVEALNLPTLTDAEIGNTAQMMASLGHPLRLRMVIILAQDAASVTALMTQLGLGTTGAAYHHLKVLMNQGLVEQPRRGTFALTTAALPRVERLLTGLFGTDPGDSGKKTKKKNKGV